MRKKYETQSCMLIAHCSVILWVSSYSHYVAHTGYGRCAV